MKIMRESGGIVARVRGLDFDAPIKPATAAAAARAGPGAAADLTFTLSLR